eukprot:SAG11_NODE_48663_length_122_cov_48.217391_1_plen_31_part_01
MVLSRPRTRVMLSVLAHVLIYIYVVRSCVQA